MTAMEHFSLDAGAEPAKIRRYFDQYGIVVVRNLMTRGELADQRAEINRLLAIRLGSLGHPSAADDIDENLNALVRIDRRYAMDIIRAIKDSPFFFGVLADARLHAIGRACLACETLLSVHDIAQFRIDPPDDDARNFGWHQDFPYNVTSLNAVTVWYPLKGIAEEMGPLVVAPGSHRSIAEIEMDFGNHQSGTGSMHSVLRFLVDEADAECRSVALCPVEEGTVIFFHSLLLHRSSANRSTRSRWIVNPRFSDAAEPAFAGRGWLAVRDKTQDAFARYFPHYVKVRTS
jgi:ectoine hydroxylase-related dioxygenase (phytanoyl-CoA dioxygenase family)